MSGKGLVGLFLLLLGLTIMVAIIVGIIISRPAPSGEPIACPQDARQCPDGSFVSRQPPNCEFSPCP